MFKGTIINTKFFKQFIESTKELINETNINLTSNGISIKTVDNAIVSLCDIHFNISDFQSIECTKDFTIGLSLISLLVILKFSDEPITIEYSESNQDVLYISFINTEFEIKLMDIESDDMDIPNYEYPCIYEYDSAIFSKIISNYTLIGSNDVRLTNKPYKPYTCTNTNINTNTGTEKGDGSLFFHLKGDTLNCIDNPTPKNIISSNIVIETNYILKFISKFMKASFLSDTVKICVAEEYPLIVEFKKSESYIRFYLAPKLKEDD